MGSWVVEDHNLYLDGLAASRKGINLMSLLVTGGLSGSGPCQSGGDKA